MAMRNWVATFTFGTTGLLALSCSDGGGSADAAPDGSTDADADSDSDGDAGSDAGEDGGTSQLAVDVSAGVFHTCAAIEGGNVKCWGSPQFGALGYGNDLDAFPDADTSLPSTLPFVNVGVPVARIEASYYFTCALFGNGGALCWGFNSAGQLGQAVGYSTGVVDVPADYDPIVLDGPVTQVSTGGGHACALLESGVLECWGNNSAGQLGDGNGGIGFQSYTPVVAQVGGIVAQVSAGGGHTCAVLENGEVYCWGQGGVGALGYGNTEDVGDDEVPADVGPVDIGGPAKQVSCGGYHTCALLESGEVLCWGLGDYGALGYGNTDTIGDDEVPASVGPVDVGGPVAQVSVGTRFTCVLLESGDVKCWGIGSPALGYGNMESIGDDEVPAAVGVVNVGGVTTQIDTGMAHTCALLETGDILCWGDDGFDQLGYGLGQNIGDDETPADVGPVQLF